MTRFGIEEEFLLLDEGSLVPVALSGDILERIGDDVTAGRVTTEYLASQVEALTDPVRTGAEAVQQLTALRTAIGRQARARRAIAAPTGAPFTTLRSPRLSPSAHYDDVARRLAHLTREHEVNGLHVHVEVPDEEERVRALNRLRAWLPLLLALSTNSPFGNGLDTGFASWRSMLIRRLPSSWCPPRFADVDDYRTRVDQLLDLGTIGEATSLSWAVRLSERYPTVEARVADTQLTAEDAVLSALLTRGIALSSGQRIVADETETIDASIWMASRAGMTARLLDPLTGGIAPAWTVAEHLFDDIGPVLDELGDADAVRAGLDRLRADGTGAARQRAAHARDGLPALRRLLQEGTGTPAD
ncbi:carboxylate-amine ligase [Microbacterium paraoxydans]|uniref:carboxylate-amine ligase n=1 Tax=Microbacterium paraoxydans TaxID=199592 RepID=UPI003D704367